MQTCLGVVGWSSVLPGRLVLVLSSGCPPCRARVRGLAGQMLFSRIKTVPGPRENGETGAGRGMNPDRPAKAAQIQESPSALALAVPAQRSGNPGAPGTISSPSRWCPSPGPSTVEGQLANKPCFIYK